ncbi:MAG: hypothetical protein QG597_188 [Actinomycetota bacterium]|nr:hypothetical protein [Actinomycetota bacterium]
MTVGAHGQNDHYQADHVLVTRLRQAPAGRHSKEEAFTELVDTHHALVYAYCRRRLSDHHLAQDVTQEVFLQAWRTLAGGTALQALDRPDALDAWLVKVAYRGCLDRLVHQRDTGTAPEKAGQRSHHRRVLVEVFVGQTSFDELGASVMDDLDPHELVVSAIQLSTVRSLLDEILTVFPERLRLLYRLHHREGVDGAALARSLGVSGDEVSRLKHDLKQHLATGLIANLVARDGRGMCTGSPSGLDALLSRAGWVSGPLPRRLVTTVTRHIEACPACSRQRDLSCTDWRPALGVLLVSPQIRQSVVDHLHLADAASTAPGPIGSGQVNASVRSPRTLLGRRAPLLAAAPVVALLLAFGLAGPEEREPLSLTPVSAPPTTSSTVAHASPTVAQVLTQIAISDVTVAAPILPADVRTGERPPAATIRPVSEPIARPQPIPATSTVPTAEARVTTPDPTPVDPTPVDPTPVDPAPVDPTPVDPAPVDPAPVDPAPVDPAPVDPAPVDPAPVDPAPVDPAPVDPAPVDPAPVDPTPVDPTPVDPTPAGPPLIN